MDFSQLLGAVPAALIPVALVLYFSDQNTKKWMEERREIALAILNERKDWLAAQQHLVERYDTRLVAAVEAMSKMASELHGLRGKLTEFMLTLGNERRSKE